MSGDKSKLAAAQSCNSDTANNKPGATQNCSDVINISVFFDGTGNNKDVDEPLKRWSNPARIWRSAQSLTGRNSTNFAFYVSGVGTPYNGEPTHWEEKKDAFIEDTALGEGFGGGGTRRTQFGQRNVNDALRRVLIANAKKFNATTKEHAEKSKKAKLSELGKALAPYNLVTVINLSVFGFSRGAALARAFVNDFLKQCDVFEDGRVIFNHHPVRIRFLGLFDTVASFGLPSLNVDMPFDERNLVVPDAVERCVHFVAAHELRFSFPVDLIRKHGKYRPNWIEAAYPGVHSDVGGGYEPIVQGISNNYARIPMRTMMNEALTSGVRLMDYHDIRKNSKKLFDERYAVLPATDAAFKQYMAAVAPSGSMEQCIAAHMKALYSAFGTMTRRHIKTPDLAATDGSIAYKFVGHVGIAEEADLLLNPAKAREAIKDKALFASGTRLHQVAGLAYMQIVRPEPWRLQAWQTNCSEAVLNFIRHSVHDSKAAFIASIEPFSYFRPRGMAESSRNVLARGLDWLDETGTAAKNGVIKVYHRAEGVVVETWEEGELVAKRTYKVGEKFFVDTVYAGEKYAVEVYQSGKQVLISTMEKGERMLVTSIDAAQKKAGELSRQVQSGASRVADGVGQAVDTGIKVVEDGWMETKPALGF